MSADVQRGKRTKLTRSRKIDLIREWADKCGACRKPFVYLPRPVGSGIVCCVNIDHFVPISHGGADTIENMWPLCPSCHGEKTISERMKDGGGRYCLICACFSSHTTCFDELKGQMTEYYNDVNSLTASMGTARITACDDKPVDAEVAVVHENRPRVRRDRPSMRRRCGENDAASVYRRLPGESLLNYHARIGEKIHWTGKRKLGARAMSTERHNKVYGCATAREYMLNATRGDYTWDLKHGYITVPRLDAAIGLCDLNRTRDDAGGASYSI